MNAHQLPRHLQQIAREIERYARNEFPGMAANKIKRFINGNFRAQGYQGTTFKRWPGIARKGTILVKTGFLRRSIRQQTAPGEVRTWSEARYAKYHNEGYKGTVSVRAHQRRRYTATRVGTGRMNRSGTERMRTVHVHTSTSHVKAHTRKMNVQQRQFMPITANDSPVLLNSIQREVVKKLKTYF